MGASETGRPEVTTEAGHEMTNLTKLETHLFKSLKPTSSRSARHRRCATAGAST